MIKRTGEVILGIIGAIGYAFLTLISVGIMLLQNNEALLRDTFNEVIAEDPSLQGTFNVDAIITDINSVSGMMMLVIFSLSIVAGIIAMVSLKGNKKPVLAGALFLGAAVISTILTSGAGLFGGLFYLIAGIMSLARKPKVMIEE
ncbi:DUF4064 domain-containing protein [Alkalihalobacillus sp. 1P02AB]|uniref:DUF4064 domain-containing protein n=1 Tax=Alkalihalobacillus sp. 1P02AB TaxID=3132260 RepID=UPI0039A73B3C